MSSFLKKFIAAHPGAELVPVCPELLGGLPVPRPPVKRRRGRVFTTCEDKALRKGVTGVDVTEYFLRGAEKTLEVARRNGCSRAILCKFSPSCDANGITGKLLRENGIDVINTF